MEKIFKHLSSLLNSGHSITTDSRNVPEGSIFVALKGDSFDGNKFAKSALNKGAQLAIVDDPDITAESQVISVPNTLAFLQDFARYRRERLSIPVVGLTGSNGKTTTKELLNAVLSVKYKTFATHGNLNNHIGVPLSILSINKGTEVAIIEMGANHIGEIANLCTISQPTHGLITNIGKAHLEGFGSFEGVKKAKSELYHYLSEKKGELFINSNNETLKSIANQLSFGEIHRYGNDIYNVTTTSNSDSFLKFSFEFQGNEFQVNTHLVGPYNIENILAAICIGQKFGVPIEDSINAIELYSPDNNRSQIVQTKQNTVILDAYNANPSSMEQAIKTFASLQTENPKVAILGDMLELGDYSYAEHERIANLAVETANNVIFVGKNFEPFAGKGKWFKTQADLGKYLSSSPLQGKTILLKGSRGIKLDEVMKYL